MIFNITLCIDLWIIVFPLLVRLSQTDISSRKFQYGQYAICIVALFSGQPVLTVVVAVVLGPSHAVSVWVCSIFSSEIDWHSV